MNELSKVFAFDELMVRVAGTADDPMFVAADICRALCIQSASQAMDVIPPDEKGVCEVHTLGGPQQMLSVRESGLYRLIFRSNKPAAEKFRGWVFKEVLPAIRKTGAYGLNARLWQAFADAKTGRVQLELLRIMNLSPSLEAQAAALVAARANPALASFELVQIWRDARTALLDGYLTAKNFRIQRGEGDIYQLTLDGNKLLAGLTRLNARYAALHRASLRDFLSTETGWVGNHATSVGGRKVNGWVLNTTAASRAELLQLCRELAPTPATPETGGQP